MVIQERISAHEQYNDYNTGKITSIKNEVSAKNRVIKTDFPEAQV